MPNLKAVLLWYCRTPRGWRRFPVLLGRNNRIRHTFVMDQGKELSYPEGRYQILRRAVGLSTRTRVITRRMPLRLATEKLICWRPNSQPTTLAPRSSKRRRGHICAELPGSTYRTPRIGTPKKRLSRPSWSLASSWNVPEDVR